MRLVIQRVTRACVRVEGETVGEIGAGLLVLVGVRGGDTAADAQRLALKTAELRIFRDEEGRFNRSLLETSGPSTSSGRAEALVVSQFTLYGDVRRGRRPSFNDAARPEVAEPVVEAYAAALEAHGLRVARGRFGAMMQVELVNDGPVTIIIDSADLDRPRRG
jgi:D-tyrosyl-tRNA(Tyr) deacylase